MITVKVDKLRRLTVSPSRTIAVEHENAVETVAFILPKLYNDVDLTEMTASFTSVNSSGEGNIETLTPQLLGAEIRLEWSVTGEYTSVPGTLKYELVFSDGTKDYRTIQDFFTIENSLDAEDTVTAANPAILDQMLALYGKAETLVDGIDVSIGSNGHWYISGNDTNISATGEKGTDGTSVTNVEIRDNGHLYVSLSNGFIVDAGTVKGDAGSAATVTVGAVTTGAPGSAAAVVNSGTSGAAVLNFTIPCGETGSSGSDGRNFTLRALYATEALMRADHAVGSVGDAYAVGTSSDNEIYIWDENAADWVSLGSMYNTELLEELLGIIPIDGGDFFEEYYNTDIDGETF